MTLWIRGWLNSRQLNQKDIELDQEVDDIMAADFYAIDADIEADKKDLQDGLKRKVEAVKKGIKDRLRVFLRHPEFPFQV